MISTQPPIDAQPLQPLFGAVCQLCQTALSEPRTKISIRLTAPPAACCTAPAAFRNVPTGLPGSGTTAKPVLLRIDRTSACVSDGLVESIRAATPATFGVAPEVPPNP